jgi:hypothetical protein
MLMRLEKLRQADLNLLIMFAATVEEKSKRKGSPLQPTLPKCFLGIVPQLGHHRLQMTFEEGAAVPSHTAATGFWIQDLKAKPLQIFQLRVP